MMPYINFFGLSVSTYWTMCAIGMLLVLVFSIAQSKRYGLQLWQAVVMAICINAFGIVGVYLLGFIQSGFDSFNTSFMGALIFTPVFLATVAKLFKINVLEGISFSAVPIASMGACMKIGCFFAGCCGGITINGNVFPVQLLESFISIIIVAALLIIQKKDRQLKIAVCVVHVNVFCYKIFCRISEKQRKKFTVSKYWTGNGRYCLFDCYYINCNYKKNVNV